MDQNSVFSFKGKMDSIQVLRACLAFLIFLSHFECLSRYNLSAPVFLFYTISGFVVMLSTRKKDKVKGFLKRRFVRTAFFVPALEFQQIQNRRPEGIPVFFTLQGPERGSVRVFASSRHFEGSTCVRKEDVCRTDGSARLAGGGDRKTLC